MNLAEPAWLLVFPAAMLLAILARVAGRHIREQRIGRLIASRELREALAGPPDARAERTFLLLFGAGCLLMALALARPYVPKGKTNVQRLGLDVFIALDLSRSMDAEDIKPRRLDAAKAAITNFVERLAGDRVSLIAFSGDARVVAPLTFDGAALGLVLKFLDTRSIGKGGTSLTAAIELAAEKARQKELGTCALILLTDGEDLEGDPILTARHLRERQGLRLFAVGVGTVAGARVPLRETRGHFRGFAKDRGGAEVISKLDEGYLTKLAEAGGGRYVPLGPDGAGMLSLLDSDLRALAKSTRSAAITDRIEIFEWPLGMALFLLTVAAVVPHRRPRRAFRVAASAALCAMLLPIGSSSRANDTSYAAEALMLDGRAPEALAMLRDEIVRNPDDPRTLYNYGLAAYACTNFGVARTAWKHLSACSDRSMAARCLFQLGNIEFKEALAIRRSDTVARIAQIERARDFYLLARNARSGAANESNLRVATGELISMRLDAAQGLITSVERRIDREHHNLNALRSFVEKLETAIQHLESILGLEPDHGEAKVALQKAKDLLAKLRLLLARAAREELQKKMAKATPQSPDKTPLADDRHEAELDRQAADFAKRAEEAVDHYNRALESPMADPAAQDERTDVKQSGADVMSQNAERHIQAADNSPRDTSKIEQLQRAREGLNQALNFTPEDQPVRQKKTEVERRIEELAQQHARQTLEKTQNEKSPQKKIAELGEARQNLSTASEIDPKDKETRRLQKQVDQRLAEAHEARGDEQLASAKKLGAQTPAQAIANAEQAATDYGRAERFDRARADRIEPKRADALREIDRLRADLAKQSQAASEAKNGDTANLPEIPSDMKDVQFQFDARNGRDRQRAAILNTKEGAILRDW